MTSGPDRGKSCDLTEELVRVGKGEENQLVLSDPTAADFHLNILQREGRFAISTQATEGITVEGNAIPPDRWVWLPELALIQVTRRTALEFQSEGTNEAAVAETAPLAAASVEDVPASVAPLPKPRKSPAPVPSPIPTPTAVTIAETATITPRSPTDSTGSGEKLRRKRAATDKPERKTVTARFITDGPGDPLVKLGEDGHLPELRLEEGKKRPGATQEAKRTNPIWLILIMAFGFGLSILLLFVDMGEVGGAAHDKAEARKQIEIFCTQTEGTPKPYQERLRQALQARSRRDYATEQKEYRRVLDMLRSEGKNAYTGVTGTPERDLILERQIGILLKE